MKRYEVHYFTENEGDGTHLGDVRFPETPQIGWTLIINQIRSGPRGRISSGIGVVVKVVMEEESSLITVFVKETKL